MKTTKAGLMFGVVLMAVFACVMFVLPKGVSAAYVWNQVNIDGFNIAGNLAANGAATIFDGRPYVFAANNPGGVKIYMCDPALDATPGSGCDENGGWSLVNSAGFADASNFGIAFNASKSITVSGDNYLYTGTSKNSGAGELWRCSAISGCDDQIDWEEVTYASPSANGDGFGNPNNIAINALEVHGGYLYAGTQNDLEGGEIWRCLLTSGCDAIGDWSPISTGGLPGQYDGTDGQSENRSVVALTEFDSKLFASTQDSGAQNVRVYSCSTCDGTDTWTQVNADGFGDTSGYNTEATTLRVFGSNLYAGTSNPTQGGELWTCTAASGCDAQEDWNQVGGNGLGYSAQQFVGTTGEFGGNFLGVSMLDFTGFTGSYILESPDGINWSPINNQGMDGSDIVTAAFGSTSGFLYAMAGGLPNYQMEVWRTNGELEPVVSEFKTLLTIALAVGLAGFGFVMIRKVRMKKRRA